MYFSNDIDVAKEYALGLDDCGNYNSETFIYEIKIDLNGVEIEEDFYAFDDTGYYDGTPDILYNPESGYIYTKYPKGVTLIDSFKNEL